MRTYANQLIIFALLTVAAFAQSTVLTGSTILTGSTKMGAINISHIATANMGGVTALGVDSGAAITNFGMCADFVTPPASSTVNTMNDWVDVTAGSGLWGHAIYNDGSGFGTVNTQNAATGGCASNCVTYVSGNNFLTSGATWAGSAIRINGVNFTISSVQSGTVLTLTTAPGTLTGVNYIVTLPGTLLAGTTSSAVPTTSAWNNLLPSGIGTLTASTRYWACFATTSATRTIGDSAGNGNADDSTNTCTGGHSTVVSAAVLGSPFASWPGTFPAGTWIIPAYSLPNGCYAVYVNLSYTSTSKFDIVTASGAISDSVTNPVTLHIPPTVSGDSLMVAASFGGTATLSSVTDSASDTLTIRGTPAVNVGSNGLSFGIASIDRATAGTNGITVTFSATPHFGTMYAEVAGTANPSFDVVKYDATAKSSPYTSDATTATANAAEFLYGGFTTHAPGYPNCLITGTNGWTLAYYGAQTGTSNYGMATLSQTTTTSGTQTLTATIVSAPDAGCGSASDEVGGLAAFK